MKERHTQTEWKVSRWAISEPKRYLRSILIRAPDIILIISNV